MQAHFRARSVAIDQAGLRWMGILADVVPRRHQWFRDRRPWPAGFGMSWLVPVALGIRQPAERAAVRHPHGKRPARFRHARREQRRGREDLADGREQSGLVLSIEIGRIEAQPRVVDIQAHWRTFIRPSVRGQDRRRRSLPGGGGSPAAVNGWAAVTAADWAILTCGAMTPSYMWQGQSTADNRFGPPRR